MAKSTWGFEKAIKRLDNLNGLMQKNMRMATLQNATLMRDETKKTIRNGRPEWEGLSSATIKVKGSTKPLIDHGDLMNSINYVIINKDTFFIGIPRTAKNPNNVEMVYIAAVMEFGATIRPKKAQALAIPLNREAARMAQQAGGVGKIPGLFKPKGTQILAIPDGQKFKPMFMLLRKVVIPPRSFIATTYNENYLKFRNNYRMAAIAALRGKLYLGRNTL